MAKRLPASVLEANGSFIANPERRRVDLVGSGDLGQAPDYFTTDQTVIWNELKSNLPVGLAKSADRFMTEIACRLMSKFRDEGLNASELSQLINALGRLGASPADRTKCSVVPEVKPETNAFAEFVS